MSEEAAAPVSARRLYRSALRTLIAAALFATCGCRREPPPNFVFVLVDALRADHVSSYGYRRPTTPALDRLAAAGVRFADVLAPSNHTHSSMPSIWTGLPPSLHRVLWREDILDQRFTTLAELLRERGYRTGAWCPNPSLDRVWNIGQGFEVYDDALLDENLPELDWRRYETAAKINARALAWIDADPDRPFFAWLHYRDVHGPYLPPPGYDRLFTPTERRPITQDEADRRPAYLTLPGDGDDLAYYLAQYDGEIRYADDRLGELLAELERRGLRRRTVVIVTADHGEAFLDHGEWNHDMSMHAEELRVPLMIARPGGRPRVVERLVSTMDLFPTLLELAGITPPRTSAESLLPLLEGRDADYRRMRAFAESWTDFGMQRAVVEGRWKLILDPAPSPPELYDRTTDPGELRNLAGDNPGRVQTLAAAMAAELGATAPDERSPTTAPLDPELLRRLKSLGYVR